MEINWTLDSVYLCVYLVASRNENMYETAVRLITQIDSIPIYKVSILVNLDSIKDISLYNTNFAWI